METIKEAHLIRLIARLNKKAGKFGGFREVGAYMLDYAYGGYSLVQVVNDEGGVRLVSVGGRLTKRELYNQLLLLVEVLNA